MSKLTAAQVAAIKRIAVDGRGAHIPQFDAALDAILAGIEAHDHTDSSAGSGSGAGIILNGLQASEVRLSNSDVLHLNATPKVLAAAPGPGLAIAPFLGVSVQDTLAGGYTDGSGFNEIALRFDAYDADLQAPFGIYPFDVTQAKQVAGILPWLGNNRIFANSAIILKNPSNGSSDEYTGGNAANSLFVRLWYAVVPAPAGINV